MLGLKLLPLVSSKSRLIIPSLTDILTFSEIFKGWRIIFLLLTAVIEKYFPISYCVMMSDGDDVESLLVSGLTMAGPMFIQPINKFSNISGRVR